MMKLMKRLWREEEGQGLTEYALLLAALVIIIIVALAIFGNKINAFISGINLKYS